MLVKSFSFIVVILTLSGCGEEWTCKVNNQVMYSISDSGELGGADKGCSCSEIRNFNLKVFGTVNDEKLKSDFGC